MRHIFSYLEGGARRSHGTSLVWSPTTLKIYKKWTPHLQSTTAFCYLPRHHPPYLPEMLPFQHSVPEMPRPFHAKDTKLWRLQGFWHKLKHAHDRRYFMTCLWIPSSRGGWNLLSMPTAPHPAPCPHPDLASAFWRVPTSQPEYRIVILYNPYSKSIVFHQVYGMCWGLSRAPLQFNRGPESSKGQ